MTRGEISAKGYTISGLYHNKSKEHSDAYLSTQPRKSKQYGTLNTTKTNKLDASLDSGFDSANTSISSDSLKSDSGSNLSEHKDTLQDDAIYEEINYDLTINNKNTSSITPPVATHYNQRLHRSTTKEVRPYAVSGLLYGCKTSNSCDSSLNLSDYRGSLQDNDTFYEGRVCDSQTGNACAKDAIYHFLIPKSQRLHESGAKEVSPYAVSDSLYRCKTPNSYDSSLNLSDYRGSLQDNDTLYEEIVCDSKIDNTGTKYATIHKPLVPNRQRLDRSESKDSDPHTISKSNYGSIQSVSDNQQHCLQTEYYDKTTSKKLTADHHLQLDKHNAHTNVNRRSDYGQIKVKEKAKSNTFAQLVKHLFSCLGKNADDGKIKAKQKTKIKKKINACDISAPSDMKHNAITNFYGAKENWDLQRSKIDQIPSEKARIPNFYSPQKGCLLQNSSYLVSIGAGNAKKDLSKKTSLSLSKVSNPDCKPPSPEDAENRVFTRVQELKKDYYVNKSISYAAQAKHIASSAEINAKITTEKSRPSLKKEIFKDNSEIKDCRERLIKELGKNCKKSKNTVQEMVKLFDQKEEKDNSAKSDRKICAPVNTKNATTIAERIKLLEKKGLNDTNNCQAIKKSKVDKVIQGNGQSNNRNTQRPKSLDDVVILAHPTTQIRYSVADVSF